MRAIVLKEIGDPDKLVVESIEKPEPKEGEVLIKLKAAALNRRDVWIALGAYPKIQTPAVCGSDGAGVIEKCGPGIDKKLIGQDSIIYPALNWGDNPRCGGSDFRVLGMPEQGTFAEYICVPRTSVFPKPSHLSWEEAAALPLAGLTSWRATFSHGELKKNEKILITGIGGGCATFVLQWANAVGAIPYVTSSSEEKIGRALQYGAEEGFNYKTDGWERKAKKSAGGFDLIVDSGGGDGLNSLLDTLNPGGRYVFFGATQGDPSKGLSMAKLFFKQIRVQGSTMGSESEFFEMIQFVENHDITPIVDGVFPLDRAVEAHNRMLNAEQIGKIVIKF